MHNVEYTNRHTFWKDLTGTVNRKEGSKNTGRCREGSEVGTNMKIFPRPGKRKVENSDDPSYGTDVPTGAVPHMKNRHSTKIT